MDSANNNETNIPAQDRTRWVKVKDVAVATGFSTTKIRSLIEEGFIEATRLGNGHLRIQRTELTRFLAEGFRDARKQRH